MKNIMILFFLFTSKLLTAQAEQVMWEITLNKIDKLNFEWVAKATIQKPWHIYSQFTPKGGPLPTIIVLKKNPMVQLEGKVIETGKMVTKREEVFDMDVKYYDGSVTFSQKIKLKKGIKTNISGTINYMVCNDVECLPPKVQHFSIATQ
jgi:hypothetical protein